MATTYFYHAKVSENLLEAAKLAKVELEKLWCEVEDRETYDRVVAKLDSAITEAEHPSGNIYQVDGHQVSQDVLEQ